MFIKKTKHLFCLYKNRQVSYMKHNPSIIHWNTTKMTFVFPQTQILLFMLFRHKVYLISIISRLPNQQFNNITQTLIYFLYKKSSLRQIMPRNSTSLPAGTFEIFLLLSLPVSQGPPNVPQGPQSRKSGYDRTLRKKKSWRSCFTYPQPSCHLLLPPLYSINIFLFLNLEPSSFL